MHKLGKQNLSRATSSIISFTSPREQGQQVYPTGWYNASAAAAGVSQFAPSYFYSTPKPQQYQIGQSQAWYQNRVPMAAGLFFCFFWLIEKTKFIYNIIPIMYKPTNKFHVFDAIKILLWNRIKFDSDNLETISRTELEVLVQPQNSTDKKSRVEIGVLF